jgi:hypothetical protein
LEGLVGAHPERALSGFALSAIGFQLSAEPLRTVGVKLTAEGWPLRAKARVGARSQKRPRPAGSLIYRESGLGGREMSKKKYRVRAECPACACGDVTFLGPEKLREKFIGDEKEIDILCPMCGTKHKGKVEEVKE